MAANNQLKLQIVTQLDAAGIKATKDQIDNLELGLRRAGKTGGETGEKFGAMEKALGKLPGRLGEIGGKLGGLAGQVTMVAGAFSTGVEIGNKVVAQMREWGILPDALGELKKETAAYNAELTSLKESLAAVVEEETKRMDASAHSSERSLKMIDDETAAYFRQATALKGLRDAQGNAELMQLEREKFDDMSALSSAGYAEAAEQVGRYYDVLAEELKAKQQIEAFDRESVKLEAERLQNEEAFAKAAERAEMAKIVQENAEQKLADFRQRHGVGGDAVYRYGTDAAQDDALEKIAEKARRDAERAADVMLKRGERLDGMDSAVIQRQMERANLVSSGSYSVDRAAQAYDDYVTQTGNALGAEIDPNWSADILRSSQQSYDTQREMLEVTKSFADKLEELLELK